MLDPRLRDVKDWWLAPLARALGPAVPPSAVTVAGGITGLAAAWAAYRGNAPLALAFWLGNRLLDGLDGTLARVHGRQTDFGGYLDIVVDFAVYAAIPLGLVLGAPSPGAWRGVCVLLGTFYVNAASWMYLAAILERRGAGAAARGARTTITMPTAPVEGTETIVFYILFITLPGARTVLFWLMAALVLAGAVQRVVWAAKNLRA